MKRCVLALFAGAALAACSGKPPPPHILLIVADDLGWQDVGWHEAPFATPNLDRIANKGVALERFYVHPVCSPTRAALLTGRAPVRYGIQYSPIKPWEDRGLPPEATTLAELLHDAGYATALVGKWHLGQARAEQGPRAQGFEHFYGCLTGSVTYRSHNSRGGLDWQRNGATVHEDGYATELFGDEAVRVIQAHPAGKPLFLYLPFTAPHIPLERPPGREEAYPDLPRRRADFATMVESLDAQVGRALEALDDRDMLDDTLVVFVSDNGGMRSYGSRNLPFEGGKDTAQEGGIRVPAAVWWPGEITGGARVQDLITVEDLFPTLAAAAQFGDFATLKERLELDGRDMLEVLRDPTQFPGGNFATMVDSGRYVEAAVIRGEWKLLQRLDYDGTITATQLFALWEDPSEQTDRAAEEPDVVERLTAELARWRALHPGHEVLGRNDPPAGWTAPPDWAAAVGD
ncbi:MAG TPA: arylsulfatase [Planctomycetota bacterium]